MVNGKALKLLYRGSRDGWNPQEFHSRCDNQGTTLTIFHTNNGRVFGGYTEAS